MNICRYETFDRFCEMLFFEELTLVSPEKWNDKYENYFVQILKTGDPSELRNTLTAKLKMPDQKIGELLDFAKMICESTRCICFSMSIDAEVMWNAYNNNNKTIMWRTTDRKVEEINRQFELRIVKYDLEMLGIRSFIDSFSCLEDGFLIRNAHEFFLHKRSMFSYENELRIMDISPNNDSGIRRYHIPRIHEFIEGVLVHPLADNRYISLVERMCKHFDVPFLGRSKVYDFDVMY